MGDGRDPAARAEGGERVLDVGCGGGNVTAEIAARMPGAVDGES